jgi:hypothetical protein
MTESEVRHIYVALLDQGNDSWRQVEAVSEGEDAYRIVSKNDRPEERWEYGTGERVRLSRPNVWSPEGRVVHPARDDRVWGNPMLDNSRLRPKHECHDSDSAPAYR